MDFKDSEPKKRCEFPKCCSEGQTCKNQFKFRVHNERKGKIEGALCFSDPKEAHGIMVLFFLYTACREYQAQARLLESRVLHNIEKNGH